MENTYKASLVQQAFVGGALYPLSEDGKCVQEANGRTSCVEVDDPAHWKRLWEEKFSPAKRNSSLDPSVYLKRNAKIKAEMASVHANYLAEKERVMDELISTQASQVVAGTADLIGAGKIVAIYALMCAGIYLFAKACERMEAEEYEAKSATAARETERQEEMSHSSLSRYIDLQKQCLELKQKAKEAGEENKPMPDFCK